MVDVFGCLYFSDEIIDGIVWNMVIGIFGVNVFCIGKVNRVLIFFKRDFYRMVGEIKFGV